METGLRRIGHGTGVVTGNRFGNVLGMLAGAALLSLGIMFSLLLLAIVVTVGLLGYSYLWWRTRAIRRQIGELSKAQQQEHRSTSEFEGNGLVIEGEIIRADDRTSR